MLTGHVFLLEVLAGNFTNLPRDLQEKPGVLIIDEMSMLTYSGYLAASHIHSHAVTKYFPNIQIFWA